MKQEQKKLYKYMVFNNIWGQLNIMEYILKPPKFKQKWTTVYQDLLYTIKIVLEGSL